MSYTESQGVNVTKKPIKKHLLDNHVYLVEERPLGNAVHKVPSPGTEEQAVVYNILDDDGQCQCRAAEFGNVCKHQRMVNGTLEKELMDVRDADKILEDYLEKLRAQWPKAQIVSLLHYKRETKVGSAAALACGVLSEHSAEKLTVWSELGPLLIRVHCFKDRARYRKALSAARQRWTNREPQDVGPPDDTAIESES